MTCFHPLTAWEIVDQCKPNGKRAIVFGNISDCRHKVKQVQLPCGQCLGCRQAHAKMWALRCVHEMRDHAQNCFLTLTYRDEDIHWSHITGEQTLYPKDFTDFMKRLRKYLEKFDVKVRYFACGEYGENTHRPHYHVILFGWYPSDAIAYSISKEGNLYYKSDILDGIWKHGNCTIAAVTYETCAYVARYVTKKLNGEAAKEKYEGIEPEFVRQSRKPGIGLRWLEKYYRDVYPYDEVIMNGRRFRPPRYYDDKVAEWFPDMLADVKDKRVAKAEAATLRDETWKAGRLETKEEYQREKYKDFKRSAI